METEDTIDVNDFIILAQKDSDFPKVKFLRSVLIKSICTDTCFIHRTTNPSNVKLCEKCMRQIYDYFLKEIQITLDFYEKLKLLPQNNMVEQNKKIYKAEYNKLTKNLELFKNYNLIPKKCQVCLYSTMDK